jgi:hypothetical protein
VVITFDAAQASSQKLRAQADTLNDFRNTVRDMEIDYDMELYTIFGGPYPEDIGIGKIYEPGYSGPDLYHYFITDPSPFAEARAGTVNVETFILPFTSNALSTSPTLVNVTYTVDKDSRKILKPAGYTRRDYYGSIQLANQKIDEATIKLDQTIANYKKHVEDINRALQSLQESTTLSELDLTVKDATFGTNYSITMVAFGIKKAVKFAELAAEAAEDAKKAAMEAVPKNFIAGLAAGGDVASAARLAIALAGMPVKAGFKAGGFALEAVAEGLELQKDLVSFIANRSFQVEQNEFNKNEKLRGIDALLGDERGKRLEIYAAAQTLQSAIAERDNAISDGFTLLDERYRFRLRTAADIQDYRYKDMAFRIFRNDAIQRYRQQFDLAARYIYLTAKVYDYETNFRPGDSAAGGDAFLASIVKTRSIGTLSNPTGPNPTPQIGGISGDPGLSDPLRRLLDNWTALEGQLGFNNPDTEVNTFSLRSELLGFRNDLPDSANLWKSYLRDEAYVPNILAVPEFRRYALPFSPTEPMEPGFVFEFSTTVNTGLNYFGKEAQGGDSFFDSSAFATKLRSVGITFDNYENAGLATTPRAYLFPVGLDIMRTPLSAGTTGTVREWSIFDQVLPVPFDLSPGDIGNNPDYIPEVDSLNGSFVELRRYGMLRAYPTSTFRLQDLTASSRLIGRSVWNTRWMLIVPASQLLGSRPTAVSRFIDGTTGTGVTDIKLHMRTYAYHGNTAKKDSEITQPVEGEKEQ